MANACALDIVCEAITIASAKEKTIPVFAKVLRTPDAIPKLSGGAAFITAELLAGKNAPAPIAPTMYASETTQRGEVGVS